MLLLYALLGVVEPAAAQRALAFFARVMRQVLPVLGLVFGLLFVAGLLLEPDRVRRYLGRRSGVTGWVVAVGAGVLASGPIYPWYAMLAELRQQGMRDGLMAAFLYSRAVKLPLLPLMLHYFGLAYTLVLCLYLVGFAVLNGWVVARLLGDRAD